MNRPAHTWTRRVLLAGSAALALAPLSPCLAEPFSFTVHKAPWQLSFEAEGLRQENRQVKPDGQSAYVMLTASTGLNVSFYVEPEKDCHSARECRDRVWESMRPQLEQATGVSLSQSGDAYTLEFLLPSVAGVEVMQYNLYAEYFVDGYWVDFHLSKAGYKPADRELFDAFLRTVSFTPK